MESLSRRDPRGIVLAAILLAVTVLAWLGVLRADAAMEMSHGGSHMSWRAMATYTLQWGVMMTAMMLPSAAPMFLLYAGISRHASARGERVIPAAAFALVYLALWLLTGVPIYLASAAVGSMVDRSQAAASAMPYAIALTLLAAGIYQFSAAKRACLTQCQSPADFVMRRWRAGYVATLRLAALHAAYCVGCCWALMVVLVVAGSMSLPWVLAIALVVFLERNVPGGHRTARLVGALLVAAAVAVALRPDLASLAKPHAMP